MRPASSYNLDGLRARSLGAVATEPAAMVAIVDMVRAAGGRMTTPKRAVVAALLAADQHRTAEEIAADVHRRHPDVHESTVYRILRGLEDLGVAEHVHLGHGPAVYHLTARSHHHLVCEVCGGVQEIPDVTVRRLVRTLKDQFGFDASPRHFAISGRCRRCGDAGR
jgi:Fe2+ or Zn2+ uptake regulation protein